MKKIIIPIFLILFFLLVLPLVASAIEYPFGNMSQDPSPCEYVSVLFVWGLGIVGAVAVTAIAYGGFRYMVGQVQEGKEIIYSALLGLLLLMASWLILYTINPDLATLKCDTAKTASGTPTGTPSGTPSSPTPSTPSGTTSGNTLSEQAARDQLTAANIGVKSDCPVGQSSNCVDLEGMKQETIDEIKSIANQAGTSNVYVTAGTEGCGTVHSTGSKSHCTGDKFDLRIDPELNSYIENNYTNIGTRSDGAQQYRAPSGAIYAKEGDHWDVVRA
ncbi:MAG: hypothetical protein A2Y98_01385 [Candidatus Portnoybacteria bacterium RBG_19FT_COMBO_36_7]|uniref:Peptidase M15B domain-containing protein n=1 Tax=Candidatus Portnoybacteria bacterium RBG_19FT_COMBO_36_7 TaxID=1801992 RepID=A0A1G2F7G4_9BACT|nr:MAG: hypothetical protein A2Y98_01385 [Candidatus Portnoybacteria bacterium RBG_19FT_COMBO_36_7]